LGFYASPEEAVNAPFCHSQIGALFLATTGQAKRPPYKLQPNLEFYFSQLEPLPSVFENRILVKESFTDDKIPASMRLSMRRPVEQKEATMRVDGRRNDQLRPVSFIPDFTIFAEGSVLAAFGQTRVLCTVTLENGAPRWMQAQGRPGGWITAEYAMLPRSTQQRTPRETNGLGGRTQEIRRLVGRSLRAAFDLALLGERTCIVDCDVLQADGGTRTAAICGGYVALAQAVSRLVNSGEIPAQVYLPPVAAVSVGVVDGEPLLDLCYAEDSQAEVDFNVVMNAAGHFIEVQGTAEGQPFNRARLDELLNLAYRGIGELLEAQQEVLGELGSHLPVH
jgi:ribonuclease PH